MGKAVTIQINNNQEPMHKDTKWKYKPTKIMHIQVENKQAISKSREK